MTSSPIAYLRVRAAADPPGLATCVAAWADDVIGIIARSGRTLTVEPVDLDLPADFVGDLVSVIDGPVRGVTARVGLVCGGLWVSGPLAGQPAP